MSLKVVIKNTTKLPNLKDEEASFVSVKFRGIEKSTEQLEDTLHPEWNKTMEWALKSPLSPDEEILLELYASLPQERTSRKIGMLSYQVGSLLNQEPKSESLKLKPSLKNISEDDWTKFRLNVKFHYQMMASLNNVQKLADTPLSFQVYVYIFEGRRLVGNHNIRPFVTVKCGNKHSQSTSTKQERALNPKFNELMTFYFKTVQSDLFDKDVQINIIDNSALQRRLIGHFSIDIGTVYQQSQHTIFNKWLVLCDPHDTFAGPKGFLKASISVRGPYDDPVYLDATTSDDEVDFESNLLLSAGVTLQPATLVARFYRAKDIPRVDPLSFSDGFKAIFTKKKSTHSADPYVVITFDGQSEETAVQSSTQSPEWNEELNIRFRWPSVCNKINLQIKDKDRFFSSDDFIGTCSLAIPEIIPNGSLPTFGPCYVNIYGSPQQDLLSDKYNDMNKGKVEGVAYRGRVLVEIDTRVNDLIPMNVHQPIDKTTLYKLSHFIGDENKEYVLCAVFNQASLINTNSKKIKFEVSIGSKHEEIDAHESLVRDGSAVDWGNKKPLVEVLSKWEDCSYRTHSLNIIQHHLSNLEKCFDGFTRLVESDAESSEEEFERLQKLNGHFVTIVRSCHDKLKNIPEQKNATTLDKNLKQSRLDTLSDLMSNTISEKSLSPQQYLERLTTLKNKFASLAYDPQISIPDVIVWLLNDDERIGFCRIPANTVTYSNEAWTIGSDCGKLQTLRLNIPGFRESNGSNLSCVVEVAFSFGFMEQKDEMKRNMLHQIYGSRWKHDQKTHTIILENDAHNYELRAYLLQARSLFSSDSSGLSDPYCVVSFSGNTSMTNTVQATLTPKWYQTVALSNIRQYVRPETVSYVDEKGFQSTPFSVLIQLYDKDRFGSDDYLGAVFIKPVVRMDSSSPKATLQWHAISRFNNPAGQLLAAFELIRTDRQDFVPEMLQNSEVPNRFIPQKTRKTIHVQCLSVHELREHLFLRVNHPFIEIQCEEQVAVTQPLKDKESPFPDGNLFLFVNIPVDEMFSPPLNILVHDKRFGYSPIVGTHSVASLEQFNHITIHEKQLHKLTNPVVSSNIQGNINYQSEFDWWSKYYSSIGDESKVEEGYPDGVMHKLTFYTSELEETFKNFSDIVKTFPLYTGKGQQGTESSLAAGYFKGIVSVCDTEDLDTNVSTASRNELSKLYPQEILVRVYIVKGVNLQPADIFQGKSDSYIEVSLGDQVVSNEDDYIPNELNPIFGQIFELDAILPKDYKLTITVKDHDHLSFDDTIGSTTIDLENRFLTLHRALIGLPRSFSTAGLNAWRDVVSPVDILNAVCSIKGSTINWNEDKTSVDIDGKTYNLNDLSDDANVNDDNNQQRLAVHVLPLIYDMVPEHVETRTLYRDDKPDEPQGKLHMWVDIIPKTDGLIAPPPKVDITPRKPLKYVLRVVVWSIADMPRGDIKTSDYYVTSILNSGKIQKTDTHYLAFGGEGKFNWRFVYPFDYDPIAKQIVYHKKDHFFSLDNTEHSVDDKIAFQVWDNDFFTADDFLGQVEFCLHNAPQPASTKCQCTLETLNRRFNVFKMKTNSTVKGWLPIYKGQEREKQLTGKINLWLELLTEDEAKNRPAGVGRDEPNQYPELKKPDRPLLRFSFLDSALKTFKFSVWKKHKCLIIFLIIMLLMLAFIIF